MNEENVKKLCEKYDYVLDLFKPVELLPQANMVTIEYVSNYFGCSINKIHGVINLNKDTFYTGLCCKKITRNNAHIYDKYIPIKNGSCIEYRYLGGFDKKFVVPISGVVFVSKMAVLFIAVKIVNNDVAEKIRALLINELSKNNDLHLLDEIINPVSTIAQYSDDYEYDFGLLITNSVPIRTIVTKSKEKQYCFLDLYYFFGNKTLSNNKYKKAFLNRMIYNFPTNYSTCCCSSLTFVSEEEIKKNTLNDEEMQNLCEVVMGAKYIELGKIKRFGATRRYVAKYNPVSKETEVNETNKVKMLKNAIISVIENFDSIKD